MVNDAVDFPENRSNSSNLSQNNESRNRTFGSILIGSVLGASIISGFSYALAAAKKASPKDFAQNFESGTSLAAKALGWGTLCAFTGVGIVTLAIWKVSGADSPKELRSKMQRNVQPLLPVREQPPTGRSDFSSIRDLFQYLDNLPTDADSKSERH